MRRLVNALVLMMSSSLLLPAAKADAAEQYPPGVIPVSVSITPNSGPAGTTYTVIGTCPHVEGRFVLAPQLLSSAQYVTEQSNETLGSDETFHYSRTVLANAPIGAVIEEHVFCGFSPTTDIVGENIIYVAYPNPKTFTVTVAPPAKGLPVTL
jgi:hypothetical protein